MANEEKPNHVKNGEAMIDNFNSTDYSQGHFEGLTKREYFAGLALQGLLSANNAQSVGFLSQTAVKAADELLKALEK